MGQCEFDQNILMKFDNVQCLNIYQRQGMSTCQKLWIWHQIMRQQNRILKILLVYCIIFIFYFIPLKISMKKSNIAFQSNSSCLSCWGNTQPLDNPSLIRQSNNYSSASLKYDSKKLSLKKILGQKQVEQKYSTQREPIHKHNHSVQFARPEIIFSARQEYVQSSVRPVMVGAQFNNKKMLQTQKIQIKEYDYPLVQQNFSQRIIIKNPTKRNFDLNIQKSYSKQLYQTTKFEHQKPAHNDFLMKTRKIYPHQRPISNLTELKQSLCLSQLQNESVKERLEESQVLVNYFNPNASKVMQIQNYLQRNQGSRPVLTDNKIQ